MKNVITVVDAEGRTTRMTRATLAASPGWRAVDPSEVVSVSGSDNIDHVLAEVGDDPVKAAAALDVERAGKNRPTLIAKLEAIAESDSEQEQ